MSYLTGTTVNFTICVTENGLSKTGLNVLCSIQKKSNNLFFNGTDWQVDEIWLNTSEIKEGIYVYEFNQELYDNSVEEVYLVTFKCNDKDYEFTHCETYNFIDFAKETTLLNISGNVDRLLDIEEGNWKIDKNTNQMIFYDRDGVEMLRFNLYDENGFPSSSNVFERVKV